MSAPKADYVGLRSAAKNACLLMQMHGVQVAPNEQCAICGEWFYQTHRSHLILMVIPFLVRLLIAEVGVVSVIGAGNLLARGIW